MNRRRNSASTTTTTGPLHSGARNPWVVAVAIAAGVLFAGLAAGGSWERFLILLVGGWILIGLCMADLRTVLVLAVGMVVFVTMLGGPFQGPAVDTGNSLGPKWIGAAVTEGQKQWNERAATPVTVPALPAIPTTTVEPVPAVAGR
jgi:hypothetical protein